MKILLTAEPFGFGPAAALAMFAWPLRSLSDTLSYAGTGHTLDLHHGLPYDSLHDINVTVPCGRTAFADLASSYDVTISACDFTAASVARLSGSRTIIYDMLTWHWPEVPSECFLCDLYLAQDFFGVRDRLRGLHRQMYRFAVIPPIVPEASRCSVRQGTLISMGGMCNPFCSHSTVAAYVAELASCIRKAVTRCPPVFLPLTLLSSQAALTSTEHRVEFTSPQQATQALAASCLALLTPGLGNIYESAEHGRDVIWLPPVNNSQGQQLSILRKHFSQVLHLDWPCFMDIPEPDYFGPQKDVMNLIEGYMLGFCSNQGIRSQFTATLAQHLTKLPSFGAAAHHGLIEEFGTGGLASGISAITEILPKRKP